MRIATADWHILLSIWTQSSIKANIKLRSRQLDISVASEVLFLPNFLMSFDTPIPPFNAPDPHARFLNATCLDLLLIELVPMAGRMAQEFSGSNGKLDDEDQRETIFYKLETLGYRVGQGLAER